MEVLDEPAAIQSDATVLELQLRAISKKQHGDVAVRWVKSGPAFARGRKGNTYCSNHPALEGLLRTTGNADSILESLEQRAMRVRRNM